MATRRDKQRRCPTERGTTSDPKVAQLAHWQSERERRERSMLRDGLSAAVDAFYERVPSDQDVRIAIVAMYGDCSVAAKDPPVDDQREPDEAPLTSVEAEFHSLDRAKPLTAAQRRHLALETTRAASEPLFREMQLGVALANRIEQLAEAAAAGDEVAEAQFAVIMAALEVPDDDEPAGASTPVLRASDGAKQRPARPHAVGFAGR
jgi:hypothetical protein